MPKTQQDFLEEARREIPEVSVEEVEARRKRGDDFILLDVREKDEVRAGYIDGAVTIPRGFLEFQAAGQIPNADKDVVVYCAGGARSLLAAKVLRSMGYDQVSSMAGGITRWRDAGYAVVPDRREGARQAPRRQSPAGGSRWPGITLGALPGCGWYWYAGHCGCGRCGPL